MKNLRTHCNEIKKLFDKKPVLIITGRKRIGMSSMAMSIADCINGGIK